MDKFEIFKSEGGWRYCGALWAGNPVIDQSPWFATRREAEKAARRARALSEFRQLAQACETCASASEIRWSVLRLEDYARRHARLLSFEQRVCTLDYARRLLDFVEGEED